MHKVNTVKKNIKIIEKNKKILFVLTGILFHNYDYNF